MCADTNADTIYDAGNADRSGWPAAGATTTPHTNADADPVPATIHADTDAGPMSARGNADIHHRHNDADNRADTDAGTDTDRRADPDADLVSNRDTDPDAETLTLGCG